MPPKSELERIEILRKVLGPTSSRVLAGIGDDTAVVESASEPLLLGTDLMIEGVHFDLSYVSARDLGHKSLATALSDIAATNGRPLYALFSIALPKGHPESFLEEFYEGARGLAQRFNVDIVGGDLSSSRHDLFVDVVCVGSSSRPTLRSTARAGDWLAVSGTPGASAAGLRALQTQTKSIPEALSRAHLRPLPRFDLLPLRATASIDVSDGVASEIYHLAEASGVGFEVDSSRLPLSPEAVALYGEDLAHELFFHGGEDYELLATFRGTPPPGFTIIGRATTAPEVVLTKTNGERRPLSRQGFDHFA